jgi:cytosine/adenosine deaminase-related metal-dependent hydrolase
LRELLEAMGAWDAEWEPLGKRSADYVRRGPLREADWLIAHGTYLDETDYWQLRPQAAPDGQRVAVAYCPRSTAYFGHGPHPFRALLERGAVVCLGTDSLASARSLSMLDEMKQIQSEHPDLPAALSLTMATLSGAWALRREQEVGSLLPGKRADCAIVAFGGARAADPHDLLTRPLSLVVATMIGGRFVSGRGRYREPV